MHASGGSSTNAVKAATSDDAAALVQPDLSTTFQQEEKLSATREDSSRGGNAALLSSRPGNAGSNAAIAVPMLDTLPSRAASYTELGELAAAGVEFQAALLNSNASR